MLSGYLINLRFFLTHHYNYTCKLPPDGNLVTLFQYIRMDVASGWITIQANLPDKCQLLSNGAYYLKIYMYFSGEPTIVYPHQHGFTCSLSRGTEFVQTFHDFSFTINNRQQIYVKCTDNSKAFLSMPHGKVTLKLKAVGIFSSIVIQIEVYLSNRT